MSSTTTPPTNYAPTEPAAAVDETDGVTAWSLDDGEDWPASRWSPRLITTLALVASLALLAGAGGVAYWSMQRPVLGDVAMLTPGHEVTGTAPSFDAKTGFPDPPTPPMATVTVERPVPGALPAPAGITVEQVAAYDRQFVAGRFSATTAAASCASMAATARFATLTRSPGQRPESAAR